MGLWEWRDRKFRGKQNGSSSGRFHAVSIRPNLLYECKSVQKLYGKRFLSAEAPRLPLETCECRNNCRCRFMHYSDRRAGPRRYTDLGFPPKAMQVERRDQRDRRQGAQAHS